MRRIRLILPILSAGLLVAGCNPRADDDSAVVSLNAAIEEEGGGAIGIFSDVVNDDGTSSDDFLNVVVHADVKNTSSDPNSFYRVNFQGVQVRYTRLDGKNMPGVDVPFPLAYAIGGTVDPGETANLNLLVVTQEMKVQAPLRNLFFGEGQRLFMTVTVTVFGADQVGNEVQTTASAVVIFGDN